MSIWRRQHCRRLSTTLLVICMIIVDQTSLSDSRLRARRVSHISRRRHPPQTNDPSEREPPWFSNLHRLPYQLVRQLRNDGHATAHEGRDNHENWATSDEIGQGHAEVKYDEDSRSHGRRQLDYYVSLDSRGDFQLFWNVDSVTETIQFRLVANVNKDDMLAFGFSDYGESHNADFCVIWTDLHGRHFFQVNRAQFSTVCVYCKNPLIWLP